MARLCGRGFCRLETEPGKLYSDPSRTPHTLFLPRAKALLIAGVLALVAAFAGVSPVSAQNTPDDVHINPRVEPTPPRPPTETVIDPSLRANTKPIKKDVDLVLVPVTITDPLN